jgi:hypothetical protein
MLVLAVFMLGIVSPVHAEPVRMLGTEFAAFGRFYSVDVTTASVTEIGRTNSFYTDMDFAANGTLWAATTSLFQIDPATGLTLSSRSLTFSGGPGSDLISGVTFNSQGACLASVMETGTCGASTR